MKRAPRIRPTSDPRPAITTPISSWIERKTGKLPGLTIQLDVYRRKLEGLVVAEVEFPDEEAACDFRAPAWLGREVTGVAEDSRDARVRVLDVVDGVLLAPLGGEVDVDVDRLVVAT